MTRIRSTTTISIQADMANVSALPFPAETVHPVYRDVIDARSLRRMSIPIKMAVWCTHRCDVRSTTPIVVGTGLGCLHDSHRFLKSLSPNTVGDVPEVISPTPFIQSTHNAMAGQIALVSGNHEYNVTHVQDGHSFEAALIDACMLVEEGREHVIVGGVDEFIPLLADIAASVDIPEKQVAQLTTGSSFFQLGPDDSDCMIESCQIVYNTDDVHDIVNEFNPGLVLFGRSGFRSEFDTSSFTQPSVEYSDYSGIYMTNPGFGLDLGFHILDNGAIVDGRNLQANSISIINCWNRSSFGVINIVRV